MDNGRFSFSLYTSNQTRPLSHGITADFLFLIYTEPDEAVKSWNNGRFFFQFVPNETTPLSHGITAHFLFLIYTEPDEAVKSWDNGRFSFGLYKQKRKRPLSYGITAAFGSVYIIKKNSIYTEQ